MKFWICILLSCTSFTAQAQGENQKWLREGDQYLEFHDDTISIGLQELNMNFWVCYAQVCDNQGSPLIYTNGFQINGANYELMENGDSIYQGIFLQIWGYTTGFGAQQGAIIIPAPWDPGRYLLFNLNGSVPVMGGWRIASLDYNVINIYANGGNGRVEEKNIELVNNTLALGWVNAVKHSNGKSWWVICHEWGNNGFYKFLVDNSGIHGPYHQNIGSIYNYDQSGQSVFSPDGSKYVQAIGNDSLDIMKFDRCTGQFSNCETFDMNVFSNDGPGERLRGCQISKSGHYLYVSTVYSSIFQYDLLAQDIESTKTIVAELDSFMDAPLNYVMGFGNMLLGPDDRIYISTHGGWHYHHVIDKPDSAGLACNVVQHAIQFPNWNAGMYLPNLPNYDLGPQPISQIKKMVDTTIAKGESVQLGDTSISGLKYHWQPNYGLSSANIAQPIASPSVTTIYTLTMTDTLTFTSCNMKSDTVVVNVTHEVDSIFPFIIPTLLAPYANPSQQYFNLGGLPIGENKLEVYDVLGRKIFYSEDYQNNWFVKNESSGLYLYRLKLADGRLIKGKVVVVK